MALHQALKNLCFKSGWCYAVFWKLKRRSRMVLTWEDGFYEYQLSDIRGKLSCSETGGNPLEQGGSGHEASYSEGQIGLAVAKMSYCVYFMGEGIIGRVAFTGKHQWVFGDGENSISGTCPGNAMNGRCMLEKYPSSWDVQFAAGIKTIAVISVSQGVVQLGSTQMIMENMEWVDHVKTVFADLQNVSGAMVSADMAFEGQGGKAVISPPAIPSGSSFARLGVRPHAGQFPSQAVGDVHSNGLLSLAYGIDGRSGGFAQSNLQKPCITMAEAGEPSRISSEKGELLHATNMRMESNSLRPSVSESSMQMSEVPSASTEKTALLAMNNQLSIPAEEMEGLYYGEAMNTHPVHGYVHCSLMDASGRSITNNALRIFDRSLDSKTYLTGVSFIEKGLQKPTAALSTSVAQFEIKSNSNYSVSNVNERMGNMGGVAAKSQESLRSFGARTYREENLLVESTFEDESHIMNPNNVQPCSNDLLPCSKMVGNESCVVGRSDDFETYPDSVTQEPMSKWDCSFGIGDELSEALGPAFRRGHDKLERTLTSLGLDSSKVAGTLGGTSAFLDQPGIDLVPQWSSCFTKDEPHFLESKPEPLLDAIVASASSSHHSISTIADDRFSCRTFSSELSAPITMKETLLKRVRGHSFQDYSSRSFVPVVSDYEGSVDNQALSKVINDPVQFNLSTGGLPLENILNSWTEDMQSMKSESTKTSQSKKQEDITKPTRKRARPGESTRPRPKDRQQIQDRVRELREIVPNGSKCSIDALLEKTIKHMLFLQSVTLHADNLKKNGELKEDVESGASWAVELGSEETGRPPILVKNLNQPRQLLVEMFCEEKGHFLEIADIIRSLGLTILKGVMESRTDKICARFVVEANRDVRRVDIMMSLMHLLHVNGNSGSSVTGASQTPPFRSQLGVDTSSGSQTQALCGFPQSARHV